MSLGNKLEAVLQRVHGGFSAGNMEPVQSCGVKVKIPKGCEYLRKSDLMVAPKKDFDRFRKKVILGPERKTTHTFRGDTRPVDAISQTAKINGNYVLIIRPKHSPKHLPSMKQIAKALGTVPSKQLDKIDTIELNNQRNPDDSKHAVQYHDPNFYSAASGSPGNLTFYPTEDDWDQSDCDSTAIHEGGHAYSGELWRNQALKDAWEAAIAGDLQAPSKYCLKATVEDFAESLVMYTLSKGTPCEATARAMFPRRYAELDRLMK